MTNKYRDIFGYQIIPNLQVIDVKGSPQIPEEYKSLRPDLKFISGTDIDPQLLIEYDRSIVPYERSTWLQLWLRHPNGKSLVAVDQQGRPVGYAVIRTGPLRVALGPVYADEVKITKALLARLTEAKQTEVDKLGLYFRYSSDNKDMKHIAEEMNLVQCGHNNVQYRNVPAEYDSKKIFAFSDFGVNYA